MNKKDILAKTEGFVRMKIRGDPGHDWSHVNRVRKLALYIGKKEKVDLFIVELAALLHDVADYKFYDRNHKIGTNIAVQWLEKLRLDKNTVSQVRHIMDEVHFKGAKVKYAIKTLEGKVVQDADKLDAIGAIGIGRTFAYGGHKGREMYNPNIKPEFHTTAEQYKNNVTPTINHFYEKLLLLKDLMNTNTAKKMAERRHKFMEKFLDEFFKEWKGQG